MWGILTVVYAALAGMLGIGLAASISDNESTMMWVFPIVALLMAAANWFTGIYLNKTKPQKILAEELPRMRVAMYQAVQNGTFSMGPNQPRPTSMAEAKGQADAQLRYVEARPSSS